MRLIAKMERNYVSGRFPAELWEITAEEWHRRKNRAKELGTRLLNE
jgi:hypothetical protein